MTLSRNTLKRVGESRYPCRTPTVVRNQSPTLLLRRTAPVSYTHLRAHETRLHLVCRLLQRQHRRLFPNNSWSPTGISTLTHPFQHISGKRIITDTLEDREVTVSIGGRTITNLRFADDIDGLAGEVEELANLVERLNKASTAYGMEISAEKTKLMTNNTSGFNTEIKANRLKLEIVTRAQL